MAIGTRTEENYVRTLEIAQPSAGVSFWPALPLSGPGWAVRAVGVGARHRRQPKEGNQRSVKMKTRKLGKLEVSEIGAGCMSISANYGPPADRTRASRSFVPPTKKASRSSIPPRFTAPSRTKTSSAKRSRRSATRSSSRPSLASISRPAVATADPSTSRKWSRPRSSA